MNGRRLPETVKVLEWEAGDYFIFNGVWYGVSPNGLLANLSKHTVAEYPDGTITVSPSILVDDGQKSWHGYLERGIWREV